MAAGANTSRAGYTKNFYLLPPAYAVLVQVDNTVFAADGPI